MYQSKDPEQRYIVAPAHSEAARFGIVVGAICCLFLLALVACIAVVLGVGLSMRNSGLSSSSSSNNNPPAAASSTSTVAASISTTPINIPAGPTAAAPPGNFHILPPPVVNCQYNSPTTCGCSPTPPIFAASRVLQGYTARPNSWPWVVFIVIQANGVTKQCGGFLVTFQHVVTAAHCFDNGIQANQVMVRAGVQTVTNVNEGQEIPVIAITPHPDYVQGSEFISNDIAVLTLEAPFSQTLTVGLCCISGDTSLPVINQPAVIVGWGLTTNNGQYSNVLLQGVVEIQPSSSIGCQIPSGPTQFCAGFNGTDTCLGDGGGPIMTSVNNAWTCSGIVSFGRGDCGTNGVYTRVAAFQSFINGVING